MLDVLSTSSGQLIIIGDINIHWNDKSNLERRQLADVLNMYSLNQHISQPTHIKGHTLDLVITRNNDSPVIEAEVDSLFSDHHALLCKIKIAKLPPQKETIHYRKLKGIDFKDLNEEIASSLTCSPSHDVDEQVSSYNKTLARILNHHAPLKTKEVVIRPLIPWINDDILAAKRKRRKYERRWRSSRLTVHKEIYLAQKAIVKNAIDNAKKLHFKDKITECKKDQAKLFKIAESLLHSKVKSALPAFKCLENLVNDFNNFFIQKIKDIRCDLDLAGSQCTSINLSSTMPVHRLCEFQPASTKTVCELIKCASAATCALDPIPSKLIKSECLTTLVPVVTDIVNKSLSTGVFPTEYKLAHVSPLIKKPSLDKEIFKNYRPVSNLAFTSKLVEKVVASQLQQYLLENGLNEDFQSAYRKGHSTETALLRVQNDVLLAVDRGEAACLVLLDLSAAFDTIDHEILLRSMKFNLGVEGTALEWFRSYLTGRRQSVVIDSVSSTPSSLTYGVPQGSVLGPLLFCVYLIPLGEIIKKHNMALHIYADDTQLYCFFDPKSPSAASQSLDMLSACIDDIRIWMTQTRLKLNDDKTEFIIISSPHHHHKVKNLTLKIGDTIITSARKCRNLGVIFDSAMNMKDHITTVCRSSFFQLRNIGAVRKYLTDEACAQLIHAFVTSRIDYCNSLLANLPSCQYAKLQKIQNVAARILTCKKKFDHITPILLELHWLPIPLRIHYKILLLTFKSLHGLGPTYLKELLGSYTPQRSLRSSTQYFLQPVKARLTTYGARSFSAVAPQLWNTLPIELRKEKCILVFKSGLKTFLFNLFIANPSTFILK